ncbi:hypothetical protein ABIB90_003632 [Bradyrhizobium sp. JR4.1]|nr:hypothetical protein Bra1253DRAFT_01595 [Bradyrhizobium sp. WSM1253]
MSKVQPPVGAGRSKVSRQSPDSYAESDGRVAGRADRAAVINRLPSSSFACRTDDSALGLGYSVSKGRRLERRVPQNVGAERNDNHPVAHERPLEQMACDWDHPETSQIGPSGLFAFARWLYGFLGVAESGNLPLGPHGFRSPKWAAQGDCRPRTRPALDLAIVQNTAEHLLRPGIWGCAGAVSICARWLRSAGRSIPRRGKMGSRFWSVLNRGCGKRGAGPRRGSDPALKGGDG